MARLATPEDLSRRKSRSKKKPVRDDLAILSPDRTLAVGGRTVTMREYRLIDGMRLQAVAEPLVAQLAALAEQDEQLPVEQLDALIAQHPEAVVEMIALACGEPAEWVADQRGVEGEALFNEWWIVNSGFFVRRVQQRVLLHRRQASDGRASSSRSPETPKMQSGSRKTAPVAN